MSKGLTFWTGEGDVRVMNDMCSTCIFRPGNLMHLRKGRVATIVKDHRARDSNLVCHLTLPEWGAGVEPALCRGHLDRYGPGQLVRIAQRLAHAFGRGTGILDVTPPDTEGTP